MPKSNTPTNMSKKDSGNRSMIINKGTLQPKMIKIIEIILRSILLNLKLFSKLCLGPNRESLDTCVFVMDNC